METMDFGRLQHTDQVSSLEVGTETFKKKWKKVRNSCAVLCHEGHILVPQNEWSPLEGRDPLELTLPVNPNSGDWKGRCLQRREEAQPSSSAVGRKITGEIAQRLKLFVGEMWIQCIPQQALSTGNESYPDKVLIASLTLPWAAVIAAQATCRLEENFKKINWEKILPHMKISPFCTILATTWIQSSMINLKMLIVSQTIPTTSGIQQLHTSKEGTVVAKTCR